MLEKFSEKSMKLVFAAKRKAKKPFRRTVVPIDILISFFETENDAKAVLINQNLTKEKILNELEKINFEYPKTKDIFSKEVIKIFLSALKIINGTKEEKILPIHILSALLKENPPEINKIFENLKVKNNELVNLTEKAINKKLLKSKRVTNLREYKILVNYKRQTSKNQALKEQYFFLLKLFRKI